MVLLVQDPMSATTSPPRRVAVIDRPDSVRRGGRRDHCDPDDPARRGLARPSPGLLRRRSDGGDHLRAVWAVLSVSPASSGGRARAPISSWIRRCGSTPVKDIAITEDASLDAAANPRSARRGVGAGAIRELHDLAGASREARIRAGRGLRSRLQPLIRPGAAPRRSAPERGSPANVRVPRSHLG